jgi:hypothetical protein
MFCGLLFLGPAKSEKALHETAPQESQPNNFGQYSGQRVIMRSWNAPIERKSMRHTTTFREILSVATAALVCMVLSGAAVSAQVVDNPGFKALLRPINYATPLAPKDGLKAVIVYGKDAPWTKAAAEAVQKAVQDWSGVTLDLADDRAVTSEETWLLNDAYRKTPLVVLGNAQDNRVMHAMGTRYLLQSNRNWPGGDRYVIRSVFEPLAADANYIVVEASNQAGMDAAAAKFADLLKTFPADAKATATIPPRLRVVAGVKNKWAPQPFPLSSWNPSLPPEMTKDLKRGVTELALSYKGTPPRAGWGVTRESSYPNVWQYELGGGEYPRGQDWWTPDLDEGSLRAVAAMCLLGCREVGGRAYASMDHYGAVTYVVWLRSIFQSGVLSDKELNEFESCITLSAADPVDYVMNHIGNGDGIVGGVWSGRHSSACLLTVVQETDYILSHCRLDDRTRKEIQRRYDGARKSVTSYIRSFRGNHDDSCLGEDTVLQFYCLLQEGFMDNVRNGILRHSADMYIMTSDNIPYHYGFNDPLNGPCYAGLSGFSSGTGGITGAWEGGSLLAAAAFYYDDPQYRWFVRNRGLYVGSEAAYHCGMHSTCDSVGAVEPPARYLGVRSLPMDERIYATLSNPQTPGRMEMQLRLPPDNRDKAADRLTFRDGFDPKDAYLFLATSQDMFVGYPTQNNTIARYTDLSDIWLYTNTYDGATWSRSVVNSSTGGSFVPRAACTLEAMANLGDVSMVSSKEPDSGGVDWTRTILHWKGHYFVVLDRMEARQEDDYSFVCRWRSLKSAALSGGVWTATAAGGNALHVQSAEDVVQTSEAWPCDGSAEPSLLQQYKRARLTKGQDQTFENLLYVSGQERPDAFETRQASPRAMMVKGRTKDGDHLALIGTGGNIPLADFETDAAIYDLSGDQLHLAGVTTLKAKVGDSVRDILWVQHPVNALVDCRTGQAQIEVTGRRTVQAKMGDAWGELKRGSQTVSLADAGALPKLAEMLESLWPNCRAPSGKTPPKTEAETPVFDVKTAVDPLQKPLLRLTDATVTPTPGPNGVNNEGQQWQSTDNLEILLAFTQATDVDCIRLVGPVKGSISLGGSHPGAKGDVYEAGDFKFSLALSDDNFQKDVRKVDSPKVVFEETPRMVAGHFVMSRYPTWRIEVSAKARQVKLLPRATTQEHARLVMADLEVYGSARVDQLQATVLAADINGDGSNALVVGTSQKELAVYDADGKRLWDHFYDGEIHNLGVADLDDNGKSEVLAYLTTEKLHRVNGDGSERPIGDVNTVCTRGINIFSIAAWGPDGLNKKEVLLWSGEPSGFRVLADGTVKPLKAYAPQASVRIANVYPGEPEAMATMASWELAIWSARRDPLTGNYIRLGSREVTGSNSGNEASPPGVLPQFCCVLPVKANGVQWMVGAVACGLNCYPITSFAKGAKKEGWQYNTGGPAATAVLAEDFNGEGVPRVYFARQDGFINVFKLADGSEAGRLNVGEPIIGMITLMGKDGKPCLAIGTKFGVYLFVPAGAGPLGAGLKKVGGLTLSTPAVAFVGPGGKNKDRVYVVDAAGNVTVLAVK